MFHADSYYSIGKIHVRGGSPCQDYACAGVRDGTAYGVVSDGCSSGARTDIGSRLLALSFEHRVIEALSERVDIEHELLFGNGRKENLLQIANMLGLCNRDLLATELGVVWNAEEGFVRLAGDGVCAIQGRDTILMYRYEWKKNLPFYPVYGFEPDSLCAFLREHQNSECDAPIATCELWEYDLQTDMYTHMYTEGWTFADVVRPRVLTFNGSAASPEERIAVAVFSDGVTQIAKPGGETFPWCEAVRTFLDFKTIKGSFAKRRMARGLENLARDGYIPMDDVSYAVLVYEPDRKHEEGETKCPD